MKIKTMKTMNLPQLIEWAWDNDIRDTVVKLKSKYPAKQGIVIDNGGRLHLVGMDYLSKSNTFTIEVEEEITEDTEIPKMVEIYLDKERDIPYSQIHYNQTINRAISTQECGSKTLTFHKLNDDDTLTLIWRNGKVVE
ncbi:TPA: hypothetical protein P6V00_001476 [Staphylococcus aureus]|nr:hypothetical protein [Staphylococcus aureus]